MEWVEVTASSVEEATKRALGQLGVDKNDAEITVVEEPTKGLFGRTKGEARVRARVKPVEPRAKRSRGGRSRTKGSGREGGQRQGEKNQGEKKSGEQRSGGQKGRNGGGAATKERAERGPKQGAGEAGAREEETMGEGVSLEDQGAAGKEFLEGLLESMELSGTVGVKLIDDETVEIAVDGEGLGMLVGPKGSTLAAIQDVTRTVVQGKFPSKTDRILVDIARYRERRSAALTRFTAEVAAEVIDAGEERSLEPMSPADRKVVHDAAAAIEGVTTRSEGEDANRYVVIALEN